MTPGPTKRQSHCHHSMKTAGTEGVQDQQQVLLDHLPRPASVQTSSFQTFIPQGERVAPAPISDQWDLAYGHHLWKKQDPLSQTWTDILSSSSLKTKLCLSMLVKLFIAVKACGIKWFGEKTALLISTAQLQLGGSPITTWHKEAIFFHQSPNTCLISETQRQYKTNPSNSQQEFSCV